MKPLFKIVISSLFVCLILQVTAQTSPRQWQCFQSCTHATDIIVRNNNLFVNHTYFISKTDLATGQKTIYHKDASNIPIQNILSMAVDLSGNILCVGDSVIVHQNGLQWDSIFIPVCNPNNTFVRKIVVAPSSDIWVSFSSITNCGIGHYNGSSWTVYNSSNSAIPNDQVLDIQVDQNNIIWMGTAANGLIRFDGTNWQAYNTSNSGIPSNLVRCIRTDVSGNIWMGTSNGTAKFDGSNWTVYTTANSSILSNLTYDIDVDNVTGQAMFGTSNGLSILNGSIWTNYDYSNSIIGTFANRFVSPVACGPLGKWFVFCVKGIIEFDGSQLKQNFFTYYNSITNGNACKIASDTTGAKWLWGDSRYVTKFDGDNWTSMDTVDLTLYNTANHTWFDNYKRDSQNNLWGPAYGGGIEKAGTSSRVVYTTSNSGLPNNNVLSVAIDDSDNVWIGTPSGLVKYNGTTWQIFNTSNSPITNNYVNDVEIAPDGHTVWILIPATGQGGVMGYDGTNWTSYAQTNWPFPSMPTIMTFDLTGNLWVITSNTSVGLMKLDTAGNWSGFTTTTNPNFPSNWFYSIHVDRYNNLWLGTTMTSIVKFDGANATVFQCDPALSGGGYLQLNFIDEHENIWFGGNNGSGMNCGVFNEFGINNSAMHPIHGMVYLDENGNGIQDATESGMANQHVLLLPDSLSAYTNNGGQYGFPYVNGPYTIKLLPSADWQISSDSLTYSIPANPSSIDYYVFGLTPTSPHDSGMVYIISSTPSQCNHQGNYWINYMNTGNTFRDANVNFIFDPSLGYIQSAPTANWQSGDTTNWYAASLAPFENKLILSTFQLPGFSMMGDTIMSSVSLQLQDTTTNAIILTNYDTIQSIITCAYDPNDKTVSPTGDSTNIHATAMGSTLTYLIRFQNTGTDTAYNVTISDTLNSNLNFSSFQFIASSHTVQTTIDALGRIRFSFENIFLPDSGANELASHGFIMYQINHKTNRPNYTPIYNTAYIYFDHNPAIVTNTSLNTLVLQVPLTDHSGFFGKNLSSVFPNPANETITILSSKSVSSGKYDFKIYDVSGRCVMNESIDAQPEMTLTVSNLKPGVYFLELNHLLFDTPEHFKVIIKR